MTETRCRADAQRFARHHRNQREFAGWADAGTPQLRDLRVVDIAGYTRQCVVCPFSKALPKRRVLAASKRNLRFQLSTWTCCRRVVAVGDYGTATTWRLNFGRRVS